jgi:hypothetical protein
LYQPVYHIFPKEVKKEKPQQWLFLMYSPHIMNAKWVQFLCCFLKYFKLHWSLDVCKIIGMTLSLSKANLYSPSGWLGIICFQMARLIKWNWLQFH